MIKRNPRIYIPTPKVRPKREVSPSQIALLIFYLLVVGGIIYFLFFSQVFEITQVKVTGLSLVNQESFTKEIQQYEGRNLLLINSSKIKLSLLREYPELSDLMVSKKLPSILEFTAQERKPSIVWRKKEVSYLLDKDGYIIRKGGDDSFQNYIVLNDESDTEIDDKQPLASAKFVEFVQTISSLLDKKKLFTKIELFYGNSPYELLVKTSKLNLFFMSVRDASEQVDSLVKVYPEVEDKASEYIDLRVPGKVFYK